MCLSRPPVLRRGSHGRRSGAACYDERCDPAGEVGVLDQGVEGRWVGARLITLRGMILAAATVVRLSETARNKAGKVETDDPQGF